MSVTSYGPTRTHGNAVMPSQRPSAVTFWNLTVPSQDLRSEMTVSGGAFDLIFGAGAVGQFATVAMIGTATYTAGQGTVVNFAIEDTGVDVLSTSSLGEGSAESSYGGATTQAALQAVIQALGSSAGVNSINLSSSTVQFGVTGTTNSSNIGLSVYGF